MSRPEPLFEQVADTYVRPTMTEIRMRQRNGLRAAGSFSGCGGSTLGLKMAGWDVDAAVEFIPTAAETYRKNFPGAILYEKDIRELDAETILRDLRIEEAELDLFEGSPPCASFSAAGNRQKDWGKLKSYSDSKQRTDDLFFEWARILKGLMPRAFIAENVPGMTTGSALEEYAWRITSLLGRLDYSVSAKILNAANYGVPQERRRLIFVGVRSDVKGTWEWPAKSVLPSHTTRQAMESVDPEEPDHKDFIGDVSMEGYAVGRTWHALTQRGAVREAHGDRDAIPPLESFCDRCKLPLEEHEVTRRDNRYRVLDGLCADGQKAVITKDYFLLQVPELDRPCPTLTATGATRGAASVVHPTECRKFTPAEAKALSGFPADFILTGTREQRYERIGRAVPPPLYEALGLRLAEVLNAR